MAVLQMKCLISLMHYCRSRERGMEQDTPKQIFPSWIKYMKITGKVGNK